MKITKNISLIRIFLAILSLIILMIPWYQLGIEFPSFNAGGKIIVNSKYLVVGFLVIVSIILQLLKGRIPLKEKKELNLLLSLEKASDMILLNGLLMILAFNGFISVVIPVLIMIKTVMTETMKKISADNGKMTEKSRLGFCEKITMTLGIVSMLFYNLPFELWNFYLADALIMIATVLAVLNGCIYYFRAKNLLMNK